MRIAQLSSLILAVIATFATAQHVRAQGTQGALPDPITTPELMRYADRLGLSGEQRRALERLHDEYRAEFKVLREGEIEEFVNGMRGMQGMMPERKQFQDFMRKWERVYGRVTQVDDRLFSRMQELLTDEQMHMLPRIRMARERQRYTSMQGMMMMGSQAVDLSEIANELDMAPAERHAIDPALALYEKRLTDGMADMHKSANRMFIDMFDAFEAAGITNDTMQDPEQMMEAMESIQEIMQNLMTSIFEKGHELTALNERTVKTLVPMLSQETGRAIRNRFYTQAYPAAQFATQLSVEPQLESAIAHDQISERTRETLRALLTDVRRRADAILDDAVELAKEQQSNFSPFGDANDFDWQAHAERTQELHTKILEIENEVNQQLNALLAAELDEEARQEIAQAQHEDRAPSRRTPAAVFAAAENHESDDDQPERSQHDQYLPRPISSRDLTIYCTILGLDEGLTAVAKELHATYVEQFEAESAAPVKALAEAKSSMWNPAEMSIESVERAHQKRRDALEVMLSADGRFFNELALGVLTDEDFDRLERVRLARLRDVYSVRTNYAFGTLGASNSAGRIDIARLVRLASLPEEHIQHIDAALLAYEGEMVDALREQYEASLAVNLAQEKANVEFTRAREDDESNMAMGMRYFELLREPQERLTQASKRIADLNERTIEEIVALLPGNHGRRLQNNYLRRAYPNIYNDPAAMDEKITAAMRLPDLAEQQQMQLAELLGEYRPVYDDLTRQMLDVSRSGTEPNYASFEQEDWREYMEMMEKMQRLRFERNELNARAISRVKSILNETQLTALGSLPEPPESDNNMWGF